MKLPPCLGICTTLKASEEGIFTNQIHSTDIGEQTLSRHVSRPEKLDHFCCPNLILLTCKTSYPNRCRRSPLAANHATCFCMISIWFSAQTLFYFFLFLSALTVSLFNYRKPVSICTYFGTQLSEYPGSGVIKLFSSLERMEDDSSASDDFRCSYDLRDNSFLSMS